MRFEYVNEASEGITFDQVLEESFNGHALKIDMRIPVTRGIAIDVPADTPEGTWIQDFLIEKGFVFCGIYPGVSPVEVENPDGTKNIFQRKPYNIYGLLRPGLTNYIQETKVPSFSNKIFSEVFGEIYNSWFK